MDDAFRSYILNYGVTGYGKRKADAYTPYAAGYKMYGGGRSNPTNGPVDKSGYREREMLNRAKRDALLRRMKAAQSGNYMSSAYLNGGR